MTRRSLALLPAALLLLSGCSSAFGAPEREVPVWRTSAAQAMSTVQAVAAQDETCRQVLRVSAGGAAVRLRLSNALSPSPLVLSAVTAGVRTAGAAGRDLAPVTVRGARRVVVPAGEQVTTDPVRLRVAPGDDVLVSFAVEGSSRLSAHAYGAATGWCSGPRTGDRTEDPTGQSFPRGSRQGLVVEDVAVATVPTTPRAVVAVGDSLTDAPLPEDTHVRWTDVLRARRPGLPVVNAAIAGNRVLLEGGYGPTLVERFDRDVLRRSGVGTVVLLAGTNDLSRGLSARQLTAELARLVERSRAAGLRVVLVTVPPAEGRTPAAQAARREVNAWVRTRSGADAVVDADAVLRDPGAPERLRPAYDHDGLHLTPAGHRALGAAVAAVLPG